MLGDFLKERKSTVTKISIFFSFHHEQRTLLTFVCVFFQQYLLSSGKDSLIKLWELNTSRCLIAYTGAGTTGKLSWTCLKSYPGLKYPCNIQAEKFIHLKILEWTSMVHGYSIHLCIFNKWIIRHGYCMDTSTRDASGKGIVFSQETKSNM